MNNLAVFNNPEFGAIRTVIIDNEPWFVGKDVANALKYQNGSRDINRHVDEEDRHKTMVFDGNQNKETIVINESGLYSLILSSKLPSAKKFKRWVTSEVLPQIRKTGSYETSKKKNSGKEKLSSVNQMAKNISGLLGKAGVDARFIAVEVVRIYTDNGYPVHSPIITEDKKLWDCTSIAKELGIVSASGKPHDKAVAAIIQKLDLFTDEIVRTAYSRNGHDGITVQYKESVFTKVKEWLEENGYPTVIEHQLANGNINNCKVIYNF